MCETWSWLANFCFSSENYLGWWIHVDPRTKWIRPRIYVYMSTEVALGRPHPTHRSIGYHNQTQSLTESTVRLMHLRVYVSRDISRKVSPSPSLCYSFTHTHRSTGHHNQNHPLTESTERVMLLGLYNSTSQCLTTSLVEFMYRNSMYDDPPSVWGTLTSSIFNSLSFITPTPSHFLSLALVFSVIINNIGCCNLLSLE